MGDRFTTVHVDMLWAAQIAEFGRKADYWIAGDGSQPVTLDLVWKEGVEGEGISPGRYSHATIRNSDLPQNPAQGDAIEKDGFVYDVLNVEAYTYNYSSVVLQVR